jgi:hypothetical protein
METNLKVVHLQAIVLIHPISLHVGAKGRSRAPCMHTLHGGRTGKAPVSGDFQVSLQIGCVPRPLQATSNLPVEFSVTSLQRLVHFPALPSKRSLVNQRYSTVLAHLNPHR